MEFHGQFVIAGRGGGKVGWEADEIGEIEICEDKDARLVEEK